jgi:hypothetical protein
MKNLQKGFVIPLVIAIIALLVVGGGAYVYVNQKSINIPKNELRTKKALNLKEKWTAIEEFTPYLVGANFFCNSEANCPGVIYAINKQDYISCDSIGIYVSDHVDTALNGQKTIVARLEKNPTKELDIKALEEYKNLCKSFTAILKGDTQYKLTDYQLSGLYSLNNDVVGCQTLNIYKQGCLNSIALIYGDKNICSDKNIGIENKNLCYTNIAINNNDEKYCESVDATPAKRSCYIRVAKRTSRADLCNIIPYTQEEFNKLSSGPIYEYSEITGCYIDIAKKLKKPELCDKIDSFDNKFDYIMKSCRAVAK